MPRVKFPITRRERHVLRQICQENDLNEDSCSLHSRPEPIYNPPGPYDHPHFFTAQGINGAPQVPPSPAASSSVFLPSQRPGDVFETSMSNSHGAECQTDVGVHEPSRQSIGEVSIPPSVPTEYQIPWPPPAAMGRIPEESFYSQRTKYDYKFDASCCDVVWCLWAIATYLFDIGSDIFVALIYYKHNHFWWFVMTLSFVILPAVSMTLFSFALYIRDWRIVGDKASPVRWASRIVFLTLQLGPLLRIIDTLYYACKSRSSHKEEDKKHYFERMVDEDVDSMLMRLFEAYMEAAPQLVLQLYVLSQNGLTDGWLLVTIQFMSLGSSLVTLSMTMVSFQKALRQSQGNKAKLDKCGMLAMFLWRLFTIGTRVVALAMFAAYFKWVVFAVCGGHYIIMFIWIVQQHTEYCRTELPDGTMHHNKLFEFGFQFMAAFVHIFAFFNLMEGNTRLRALVFYGIVYVENCAMVLAWFVASSTSVYSQPEAHQGPVVGVVAGGFWIGIFFMLIYYKCLHPNNASPVPDHQSIRACVPCAELFLCSQTENEDEKDGNAIASPEEKQQMTGPDPNLNTSYERPETVRSSGPRKCVDPVPRTETPHNLSISYREPSVYDSYVKLNTSKRSIDPNPHRTAPPGRSMAYRQPETLESLLQNNSTTV